MNKYSISYQEYDRGGGEFRNETFMAPNDKAALIIAHPGICFGCGRFEPDDFCDEDKAELRAASEEDIIDGITSMNGDGCDMLFSLRNETTGVTIFDDGYCMEDDTDCNEWSEDMFEGFMSERD